MTVEYRVVSIGTLSANRLWGEAGTLRTPHATTVCIVEDERRILVDPSLPGEILDARLFERTGKRLADVTDVFCTTLRPTHRRALAALRHARWWACEGELESYREHLESLADSAGRLSQADATDLRAERELVSRIEPCPEKLTSSVHLYPLPGASSGSAGLLLTPSARSIVVAGDAILTTDHYYRGQVWEKAFDADAAMESFRDVLGIADVIVPGHDNLVLCSRTWGMDI